MDSTLQLSQLIKICEVHCVAQIKFVKDLDWYGILQIQPNADETTVKKQYRRLALILHPDKNDFPGAKEAFKLIGEAHSALMDPIKRMYHDTARQMSPRQQTPTWTSETNPWSPITASRQQHPLVLCPINNILLILLPINNTLLVLLPINNTLPVLPLLQQTLIRGRDLYLKVPQARIVTVAVM